MGGTGGLARQTRHYTILERIPTVSYGSMTASLESTALCRSSENRIVLG